MISNIIITLHEFNSKVERQFMFFLLIVVGANKNKLHKGNRKDSGKHKCVSDSERTLA